MTFALRGLTAKPEALVQGWPQDYWESYTHPTRQHQLDLAMAEPLKRMKTWMAGDARDLVGFLFYGPPGYGKTATGLKLLLTAARAGFLTRFVTAEHLAAERESTTYSFRDGKTAKDLLDEVLAPDVLLIDDVGTREYSPAVRAMLFDGVRRRLSAGHLTILTTNLPMNTTAGQDQFTRSMDGRILSSYSGCAYNAGTWASDLTPQAVANGDASLRKVIKP